MFLSGYIKYRPKNKYHFSALVVLTFHDYYFSAIYTVVHFNTGNNVKTYSMTFNKFSDKNKMLIIYKIALFICLYYFTNLVHQLHSNRK